MRGIIIALFALTVAAASAQTPAPDPLVTRIQGELGRMAFANQALAVEVERLNARVKELEAQLAEAKKPKE